MEWDRSVKRKIGKKFGGGKVKEAIAEMGRLCIVTAVIINPSAWLTLNHLMHIHINFRHHHHHIHSIRIGRMQFKHQPDNNNKSSPKPFGKSTSLSPHRRMHSPTACASCSLYSA